MKTDLWHTKDKKKDVILFLFFVSILFIIFVSFHDRHTRREDIDQDGVEEIVIEVHLPNGFLLIHVIEEDGTRFETQYNPKGEIVNRWMYVPDPSGETEYITFIWDKETKQWRFRG